jgi:hypothetical protein
MLNITIRREIIFAPKIRPFAERIGVLAETGARAIKPRPPRSRQRSVQTNRNNQQEYKHLKKKKSNEDEKDCDDNDCRADNDSSHGTAE